MQSGGGALAGLVGRCPAIESMRREVRQFGASDVRVHVFGETGTGKERVARALHELSPRASRRFVPVNAAGIGDDLLMPELFGHARGAFTGAVAARDGYVAEAEGGTLFLDEVAELSPLAQARLLRFLQEGEYRRLGETVLRKADVRLVSATNVDLAERVRLGRFRHDLWFRLKTERLVVRPLRERTCDGEQPELAERKRTGRDVRAVGEPDQLERAVGLLLDSPLLAPLPRRADHRLDEPGPRPGVAADHRIAEDVEVLERPRRLEDGAEPCLRAPVSRPARDVLAFDDDAAEVDAQQAGDASEQRRFASPVRADQARQRRAPYGEADVVDRRDGAERLRDAANLAGGLHAG